MGQGKKSMGRVLKVLTPPPHSLCACFSTLWEGLGGGEHLKALITVLLLALVLSLAGCMRPGGNAAQGTQCTHPVFTTSEPNGGWSTEGYYVHNNMWNKELRLGPQTLYACSYRDWVVVSDQANDAGAVKTYPNVHRDFANVPISSFHTITSNFAETSPHVGIYDVAYDIWTNGVATPGCTELMIWTENFHQVPVPSPPLTVTLGGRTYDVHKTPDNGYISLIPSAP